MKPSKLEPVIRVGEFRQTPSRLRSCVQLCIRLIQRHSCFKTGCYRKRMELVSVVEIELKWNPKLSFGLGVESFARDTNDGIRIFIERNRLADDVLIASKSVLPEMVTKNDDLRTIRNIVGLAKGTTE